MTFTLTAQKREKTGTTASEHIRAEGFLPAIVYGADEEALPVTLNAKEFARVLKEAGESSVITLQGIDTEKQVLIHEVDFDPVLGGVRHADLYVVKKGQKVTVEVPLVFVDVAPAEKELGAMIIKVIHEIEVEAEPQNLPHEIEISLASLATLEDQILVKDITLPAGVETTLEPEEVVVTVAAAKTEEPEIPAEAVDVANIEISEERGKKEDEVISD